MSAKILIVDDQADIRKLLRISLQLREDTELFEAADGESGWALAQELQPDLILLDVMMPGIDGGDLVNLLCRNDVLRKVPVIFLTATVRRVEVDASHGIIGGYRFLSKPIALPELLECLDDHFEDHPVAVRAHC